MQKTSLGPSPLLLLPLLVVLCTSCLDEIKLEVPQQNLGNIAIRGKLTYGTPSQIEISVAEVSDFVKFESPSPIEDAQVILKDQDGNSLAISASRPGIYQANIPNANPSIRIQPGQSYQVQVVLADGKTLESALELLRPVPPIETLNKQSISRDVLNSVGDIETNLYMQFFVNTSLSHPDEEKPLHLKWAFECTYRFIESDISDQIRFDRPYVCYFTDPLSLNTIQVFDGPSVESVQLIDHLVLEEPLDHRFYRGFYLTVYQQSLSETAYEYWSKVGALINRDGSFLEAFPAKLEGNFRNVDDPTEEIFGFFYATAEDTIRTFVNPEEADFPFQYCPPILPREEFVNLEDQCQNCLSRAGSTLQKPEYWVE